MDSEKDLLIRKLMTLTEENKLLWKSIRLESYPPTSHSKIAIFPPNDPSERRECDKDEYKVQILREWNTEGLEHYSLLVFLKDCLVEYIRQNDLEQNDALRKLYLMADADEAKTLYERLRH